MTSAVIVAALAAGLGLLASPRLVGVADGLIATRVDGPPPTTSLRWVAVAAAVGFAAVAAAIGFGGELPAYLFFAAVLLVLSAVDIATKQLPRRLVHIALVGGVVLLAPAAVAAGEPERILWASLGAFVAYGTLALLHLVLRGGLGWGDVRLGAAIGWFVGFQGLRYLPLVLLVAFGLSGLVGVGLLVTRRAGRRTMIPFGPFLAAGTVVALLAVPAG
jgi:leader peptidase (prepilin peptidase)/N-methyltransferase